MIGRGPQVAYKLNAYNVRIEDTRLTACVGSLLLSFPHFVAQLPGLIAPAIGEMPDQPALGAIEGSGEEERDEEEMAAGEDESGRGAGPIYCLPQNKFVELYICNSSGRTAEGGAPLSTDE